MSKRKLMIRFLAFPFVLAASLIASEPADRVRQAALSWTQAAVKQDKGALQLLLAEDLTYSHSNGKTIQNKAQYIAAVTNGPPRYESFDYSDLTIRIYGKTAVLTAYIDTKIVGMDRFRVRTLHVYVENDGRWQLAAFQSARVSP